MPRTSSKPKTGKNTTSITNPKTKSGNASSAKSGSGKSVKAKCNCASKAEFATDVCKLSDADIISDVLGSQKNLIKLYGTALCESSCPKLRGLVEQGMTECAEDQFDAFLYMNERGLYPTDNATAPKITQAKKKYELCKNQFKI